MKNILFAFRNLLANVFGASFANGFMRNMFGSPVDGLHVLGVCDTLDCDAGINNVDIPECGDIDFGQKIVKVFIALPEAACFTDLTDLATEATWDTKLAISPTGASKVDRIVEIGLVHNGLKPATEDETEEGAYGGDELVSRKHTVTFEIKRWNTALVTSINELRCRDTYKIWYLTNKNYLFGGICGAENVSANWGSLEFAGIGNGKSKSMNTLSWFAIDDTTPVEAAFLATKTNP